MKNIFLTMAITGLAVAMATRDPLFVFINGGLIWFWLDAKDREKK